MIKKIFKKDNLVYIVSFLIFILFYYISVRTPLAGDDWGYALNGLQHNPFKTAYNFYFSWSGRYFSELYGFLVAPNKWLWNIINPLLFSGIFFFTYKLVKPKKIILSILLILAFMLSVDDNVRMETYTWIMGTTYVIPLFLSLVYFYVLNKYIDNTSFNFKEKLSLFLVNIPLFIIGLMMENIAATMLIACLAVSFYSYLNKKVIFNYSLLNFVVSLISFVILRLSPGANYRLLRDSAAFNNLSLFTKITGNFSTFVEMTFIKNNYMIFIFSLVISLLVMFKYRNKLYKFIAIIINLLACVIVFSFVLPSVAGYLKSNNLWIQVFWIIYIINSLIALSKLSKNRIPAIYFYLLAGIAAGVMLLSPIYGARSSLYSIYFIIITSLYVVDELEFSKYYLAIMLLIFAIIIVDRVSEYYYKYQLVHQITMERNEIIKYYQTHPEDKEAWIIRYPIYSIHGADIEKGDDYHFETFKEYYQLPQDAKNIIFYFKDEY